ncbi:MULTISPECIES: MurR/RpiR family transcriptional regulator [unclassified Halomonas]|uniref:MurR/RpiR family transcriptional regulator n=1 Tax=unclassified Halomonas TaxID=2609666 RepID=UPI001EF4E089|nr:MULTISPECIES: MurR/RpiR family transcriptional regulator [unclassified Halomonas]MCG7588923.1 MurR/RpiR family transcriptional regulator [Halomonas sp. McD50-5]MCG7615084.1 MurR/RpiR family transcriptional regulator [Halomonas sp. McD50-4]BCB62502.1 RpiR family transcriptional regulator [Halomonas sp. A020]
MPDNATHAISLDSIHLQLAESYAALSPQLKRAASYVLEHPAEMAFQSIRKTAQAASVTPSTLVRLAKRLGFESYEPFREVFQSAVQAAPVELSGRASQLKQQHRKPEAALFAEVGDAAFDNIGRLFTADNQTRVKEAAERILAARRVAVVGFRDTFACAYHFAYVGRIAMPEVTLIRGQEGGLLTELAPFSEQDVVVAFGFEPYCAETMKALEITRANGVQAIVITDTLRSPLVPGACMTFTVANATPHFFPSILAAITLSEAILAECVAFGPDQLVDNVTRFESRMRQLGAYVDIE